jgi:hypothetical protein
MIERQKRAAAATLALVLLNAPAALRAQTGSSPRSNEHWVTTWATAQQLAPTHLPFGRGELVQPPPAARVPATLKDQTVRMIAHASLGGRRVRVSLANALEKPDAESGRRAHRAARDRRRDRAGLRPRPDIRRPAIDRRASGDDGGERSGRSHGAGAGESGPSVYLPEETGLPTVHPDGMHTAHITSGNASAVRR